MRLIWEASNYPWSLRLKALIPLWLPRVRKRMEISPRLEKKVLAISPRQIDRHLGRGHCHGGRCRQHPGPRHAEGRHDARHHSSWRLQVA